MKRLLLTTAAAFMLLTASCEKKVVDTIRAESSNINAHAGSKTMWLCRLDNNLNRVDFAVIDTVDGQLIAEADVREGETWEVTVGGTEHFGAVIYADDRVVASINNGAGGGTGTYRYYAE